MFVYQGECKLPLEARLKFAPCVVLALFAFQSCLVLDGSFQEKEISGLSLSKDDNPGLRKDYRASIDQWSRTIYLSVPDYVDAGVLVPRVDYEGLLLEFDGEPWDEGDAVDLSRDRSLSVRAKNDSELVYSLAVTRVAPTSTKSIVELKGYDSVYEATNGTKHGKGSTYFFSRLSDVLWTYSVRYPSSKIYLQVVTTGIGVSIGDLHMAQGTLEEGFYSANNYIPGTSLTLTVTAEDLSTRDVRLVPGLSE